MKKDNKILDMTFAFSLSILELYKLFLDKREFVLSKQLLRAPTSIGANVEEANAALTKNEFISEMSIASKEARETKYWLRLLEASNFVTVDYSTYIISIDHIINILTKIVKKSPERTARL